MKTINLGKSIVTGTLVLFLALPAVATAGSKVSDTSIKVSFADLDISKQEGLQALYRRLQGAAEEACGPITYTEAGNLTQLSHNKRCYQETLSRAVDKVGNDALQALHSG